ncbi:MAG: hypothetical protein ACI33P_06065, partial [Lysinibacillus sp.]
SMLTLEGLFRRFGYSFGFAGLFTAMYDFEAVLYGVPVIAYVLGAVLFISSWRVQKEFLYHVRFEDDEAGWVERLVRKLCGEERHREHIVWQACYTFGAAIMLMAAGTDLDVEWPVGTKMMAVLCLIGLFAATRLFDPKAKPDYYAK